MDVIFCRRGCNDAFKALVPRRTRVRLRLIAHTSAPTVFFDVRGRRRKIEDRMGVVKVEGQSRGSVSVMVILRSQYDVILWWNGRGRQLRLLRKSRASKFEDEWIIELAAQAIAWAGRGDLRVSTHRSKIRRTSLDVESRLERGVVYRPPW